MTPGKINKEVVIQRIQWVTQMIEAIKDLPIRNKEEFFKKKHNIAAAESYLRRALEALFDIGRHILVRKFAYPATEYKEIANGLFEKKVIGKKEAGLLRQMAGYRNRMVHFYHEISAEELYDICINHLDEIGLLRDILIKWLHKRKEIKI